jgi:hypothetical protein
VVSVKSVVPSTLKATLVTPTLSDALAETVIVLETVEPLVGAVMETVGAVVSGGGGSVPPETVKYICMSSVHPGAGDHVVPFVVAYAIPSLKCVTKP